MDSARSLFVFFVAGLLGVASCSPSRNTGHTGTGTDGCPAACSQCDAQGKCHDCSSPGANACSGDKVVVCNADGTRGADVKVCDTAAGYTCQGGDCQSACDIAASTRSYIGCDYWPTTTLTSELNPYFDFAVAVANPMTVGDAVQGASAQITVTIGNKMVAQKTVAPGAVETIILPWVQALSFQPTCDKTGNCTLIKESSAQVTAGAYHLTSSLPVTVYQFSPLQFEKPFTATCQDPPYKACTRVADCHAGDTCAFNAMYGQKVCQDTKTCHSYTNDASVLLPTAALKNEYIALSRQTRDTADAAGGGSETKPGFVTIVATDDQTQVMVTSSAYTEPSKSVPALSPGSSQSYMLNKGDVLQLVSKLASSPCANMSSDTNYDYCDLGPDYDLTGTHIVSDKPVAVFGGHSCAFIPYNKFACDHIEEQITPLETWGQKILVAQTKPATKGEPNVWRVVSGSDGNMITFDPASVHAPLSLDSGGYVEFVAQGGFQVTATGRAAVGQYMVGENFFDNASIEVGDPSLGLGVPVEQFRSNYDFLSPSTYTENDLTLIAPMDATITLDDQPVNGTWIAIGASGYGYQYVSLQPGAHHVTGTSAFGITVSGLANYTSYLYVGGQNLNDVPLQ